MKINLKCKKVNIVVMVAVLLIALVCSIIYCSGSGFGSDENFSMGFANNTEDFLFMTRDVCDMHSSEGWLSSDFFRNYFGVQPGEGFAFISIYKNVRSDVHPPVYFMLLNAVSTICGGEPSTLPGDVINIAAALVMVVMLTLIGQKLFGNPFLAAIIPLLWIGANGTADGIQYIRMYLSLSVVVVIEIYLNMLVLEGRKRNWLYILIALFSFVGTLTHYYFYVAFFFIAAYVTIWHLKNKDYKALVKYIGWLVASEILSVAMWPYVVKHLLHSDRGEQAMGNLSNGDLAYYRDHLLGFANTYNEEVFNGVGQYVVPVLIVAVLFCIYAGKRKAKSEVQDTKDNGGLYIGLVAATAIGFFLVLFKISYSYRWHYVSPTFALIDILVAWAVVYIFRHSIKSVSYICIGLAIIASISGTASVIRECVEEQVILEDRENAKKDILSGRQVFFIYDEWSDTIDNMGLELMQADNICFIASEELGNIDWEERIDKCPGDTSEIIFIVSDYNHNADEEFENIIGSLSYTYYNCVWKDNYLIQLVERKN